MAEQNEAIENYEISFGKTTYEEVNKLLQNVPTKKLSSEDLNSYKIIADVQARRFKMQTILGIWKRSQDDERSLRRIVAYWVLAGLFVQLAAGNTAFFLYGFGIFEVPEWVAQAFFIGMYTQIVSIVLIVVKSLFPSPKTDGITELNKMVDKL
jgi:hypothetical protein